MRYLVAFFATMSFLSVSSAQAQTPLFVASQHKCADLQSAVQEYGVIYIRAGAVRRYVSHQKYCGRREWAQHSLEAAADNFFCPVGKICKKMSDHND